MSAHLSAVCFVGAIHLDLLDRQASLAAFFGRPLGGAFRDALPVLAAPSPDRYSMRFAYYSPSMRDSASGTTPRINESTSVGILSEGDQMRAG